MMPPRSQTKTRSRPASPPTSRQVISRQLRGIIRDRGLTAYALGLRAGIDPGMIQRFLNEERDIKLDTLDRLADVLGLRLAEGARGRGRPSNRADGGGVAVRAPRSARPADVQPDVPPPGGAGDHPVDVDEVPADPGPTTDESPGIAPDEPPGFGPGRSTPIPGAAIVEPSGPRLEEDEPEGQDHHQVPPFWESP